MKKSKYAEALRCLYFLGKCSKYLYYAKKALCVVFVLLVAALGVSLLSGSGKNGCKKLKELM